MRSYIFILLFIASGTSVKRLAIPARTSDLSGSDFYQAAAAMQWKARDSFVIRECLSGNIPSFIRAFCEVKVTIYDSVSGKQILASYFVAPDYLSIGTDEDWARVNISPLAAQLIADSLYCFLPTKKMVDDIYKASNVKLEPVPLFAFRDSTPTMWHHHLIIEGQRQGRRGLIAGIKKDIVISGKILRDKRPGRVAIYGWHRLDGKPIQPLYTGHVNWWVDYSQGVRLVWRKIRVEGRWFDYKEVLQHPVWKKLLCDEEFCDHFNYTND